MSILTFRWLCAPGRMISVVNCRLPTWSPCQLAVRTELSPHSRQFGLRTSNWQSGRFGSFGRSQSHVPCAFGRRYSVARLTFPWRTMLPAVLTRSDNVGGVSACSAESNFHAANSFCSTVWLAVGNCPNWTVAVRFLDCRLFRRLPVCAVGSCSRIAWTQLQFS